MKKAIVLFLVMMCFVTVGFAQIPENLNVETISEEGKTDEGLPYLMTIQLLPATGESFFTFSMHTDLFEQSTAMITIRDRVEQFLQERKISDTAGEGERTDQQYYGYNYRGADTTKYDNVNNMTHYTSRIRFTEVRELNYADN